MALAGQWALEGTTMRRMGLAGIALLALALGDAAVAQGLRLGQTAPEVAGKDWINSPPLTMAALRGRVVLVEFWTYG